MSVIVFDVDGVLADFVYGFTGIGKELFQSPQYRTNQQSGWDEFVDLDRDQVSQVWEQIKASSVFWYLLPPLASDDELGRIRMLLLNNDVYFATSRVGIDCKWQTELWLELRLDYHDHISVAITSKKGEFAASVKADYLIDDKAGNAVFAQYHSPNTQCYLLDRPYNQFDMKALGSKVRRVRSIHEFLDEVTREKSQVAL